ncbi:radial spoke head 10 homolog B [Antennarius striatus]|uniref:radial spoke head 10 homolog B n=1 Tax=Antennarius striatus TaxID=241820 RepID=UPI0035B0DB4A
METNQASEETVRREMIQGEHRRKSAVQNNKEQNEHLNGNADRPQTTEEKENIKLDASPSADGEAVVSSLGDVIDELPTLLTLTVLRVAFYCGQHHHVTGQPQMPVESGVVCLTDRYEGDTLEGQFHGQGDADFDGGHKYKGMFSKGFMEGFGVFIHTNGLQYEGEFVCNKPMGQGVYTWPDGSSFNGDVYDGLRHGNGTYKCTKSAVSYTGQWNQGKRHGKGVVYYNQNETSWYKGDWVENNKDGWGIRRYPSGNIYSGEWKKNLRHGKGTMEWLNLRQQYIGMWLNGFQHGRGTHTWIQRHTDGAQYSPSNQYTGDFIQGQRHGHGTFYYACGVIYEGEWRNNKRHTKGKFAFKDGRVFEGELTDDQMMTQNMNGNTAKTTGSLPLSGSESTVSVLPDMALNTQYLLDVIPEIKRDSECKQVELVILIHAAELRSIYSFYSRLGHEPSPDNVYLLTRLQLWRLLKDCKIHHHNISLSQINHFMGGDTTEGDIHSPFTPILLSRFLGCLVVVSYHIYHKEMVSQKNLLVACFSRLMTDDILLNAKNVKGFLFRQPDCTVVAVNHVHECWEIYQAFCHHYAARGEDQILTCRHLLYMFKDLYLLNDNLTIKRLLEIITAESLDPKNPSSCLDQQIAFLEFFEVLVGAAEVKCQEVSEDLEKDQLLSSHHDGACRDIQEVEMEESSSTKLSADQDEKSQDIKTEVDVETQSAEQTEEHTGEEKGDQTTDMENDGQDLGLWEKKGHQFFKYFFFPAFGHNQSSSRKLKEDT